MDLSQPKLPSSCCPQDIKDEHEKQHEYLESFFKSAEFLDPPTYSLEDKDNPKSQEFLQALKDGEVILNGKEVDLFAQ